MTYIVTRNIIDTKDNNRFYEEGDTFPREGFEVSKDRVAELIGKGVLSAKGEETPAPTPTPSTTTPKTGDRGDISLYAGFMLVSGLVIVCVLFSRKQQA